MYLFQYANENRALRRQSTPDEGTMARLLITRSQVRVLPGEPNASPSLTNDRCEARALTLALNLSKIGL